MVMPAAVLLACNALTGVGELATTDDAPCIGIACTPVVPDGSVSVDEAAITPRNDASAEDARVDGSGGDAASDTFTRPSYCTGIVLYARFDGTLATAQGQAADSPPALSFVPGKYGNAAAITGNNQVFYAQGGANALKYPTAPEGTAVMWVKAQWTWPSNVDRVLWKTMPSRLIASSNSSPYARVDLSESFFGATNAFPDGATLNVGSTSVQLAPYWKNAEYNHVAETWSQTAPTITFTLNGAESNPSVTRRETSAPWVPDSTNVAFVRLSSAAFPFDAAYDDFALWSRALSLAELKALYGANKPLGESCGL
jgi:hypothetical protein